MWSVLRIPTSYQAKQYTVTLSSTVMVTHLYLVNLVSDNHADDLLAGAICIELIEPGLKIVERVAVANIVHCQ